MKRNNKKRYGIQLWGKTSLAILLCYSPQLQAQVARFPIEFNGKHIFIRAGAGKSDSLRFVFDSGASNMSIDSAAAEHAGISRENAERVYAGGHGGAQFYLMAKNQTFRLGGVKLENVNPLLVDFSRMTRATGMKLDGLIGYELLNTYVTGIDFERKEMSLYNNIKEADTSGYTGIPFEFNKGVLIPRFPVTITLPDGEQFTGRVMFDSGGFFTLLVSIGYNKFHGLSQKLPNRTLRKMQGLNATNTEERAAIKGMRFNGFELGEMPIDLTINDKAEASDGYLGMIGIEIIQKFNIILDYADKKIYLKPNSGYQKPFPIAPQQPKAN